MDTIQQLHQKFVREIDHLVTKERVMRMKRKILSFMLVATVAASTLLGCGQKAASSTQNGGTAVDEQVDAGENAGGENTNEENADGMQPSGNGSTEEASITEIQVDEIGDTEETKQEPQADFTPHVFTRADFDLGIAQNTPEGYSNMAEFFMDGYSAFDYSWIVALNPEMSDENEEISMAWETHRGISLGDSLEEVYAAYGESGTPSKGSDAWSYGERISTKWFGYAVALPNGMGLQLEFITDQNDEVIAIFMEGIDQQFMHKVTEPEEFSY